MDLQQLFNTCQSPRSALRKLSMLARASLALNAGLFAPGSIELIVTESRINFTQDPNYYPLLPSLDIYLMVGFMMTLVAEAVKQFRMKRI